MRTVREITEEIVAREGGYVNDPQDPGGATNYGITIGTLRRLGIDMDGDGDVDVDDVKRLDRGTAITIMERHYYHGPGIARLPKVVQPSVFDMYVNAGANAVKILQRLLGQMGERIAVDGVIGPQTCKAALSAVDLAPLHFVDAYGIARRDYYYGLGDARPSLRKFARRRDGGKGGWIRRAEEFISPRFHLSTSDHAERVRAWG